MTTLTEARSRTKTVGTLLTPRQVAERLGVQLQTLADWRFRHRGPIFLKVGRLVRYPETQLEAWLAEQLHKSAA